MPPMASSIHPDFRDDVTVVQARAADEKTEHLFFEQQVAKRAGDTDRYLQLAQEMLQTRLGVYKPDSMPVGDAWCLIGSAYQRESKLQEAIEATEKSIEIHAAGDNEDNFVLAREQFCLILEDMEKLSDAKEIRLRGASTGRMVCSSPQCHFQSYDFRLLNRGIRLFNLTELHGCGGCRSAFYCSQTCQKQEWKRHKSPCKKHVASKTEA
ncbi:hypothetical protein AA0120_g12676 [Alternaria tenuissima]|nr:hypothetical protein AA0120_g12676 [Alternaria tenuissima]